MQSIIISGKNTEKLREEAQKICGQEKISEYDINIIQTEKMLGIGDIRNLQNKIFLKPLGDKKAVIVEMFSGATNQAQNAFLKILEEPPANTIIIILVASLDFILPTVLSRCNLITVKSAIKPTDEDREKIISMFKNMKISDALVIASNNSRDKETALSFLENLITVMDNNIDKGMFTHTESKNILKKLQKAYTIIKSTNVNLRFALENLFLDLISA